MIDVLNLGACLLTIAFGAFGFLAPRYTAQALDLAPTDSTMGLSELRASVGGLFVVAAIAAIWLDAPLAFVMLGFCYLGAAMGRFVSLGLDQPPFTRALVFGLIEAVLAGWLILANFGPS
ncbi:MAG: DUF4345 family protein [Pseudomonadota bacterium]